MRERERGPLAVVVLAVVAAWALALAPTLNLAGGHAGVGPMASMPGMPEMAVAADTPLSRAGGSFLSGGWLPLGAPVLGGAAMWLLMVVAMMLPAELPVIRYIASNSLRVRRRLAVATFALSYLVVWLAVGIPLIVIGTERLPLTGVDRLAVTLAVATLWQVTPQKRRALRDCHRTVPLPPTGPRATKGVVRFGLVNGVACIRSCWAMMLAMAVAEGATMPLMVVMTAIVTGEKLARRPRRASRLAALVLASCTIAATVSLVFR